KLHAFFCQLLRFFRRRLTIDPTRFGLAVVNAPGFFREVLSYIVAVRFYGPPQLMKQRTDLFGLWHHRRCLLGTRLLRNSFRLRLAQAGRHERLADSVRATFRATDIASAT